MMITVKNGNSHEQPNKPGNIILLPDYEELKTDVEKLRTELSVLVLEQDELLYVECKNIEMAYILAFGSLEYKVYERQCSVLRLKRKIELIQTKKNRQEKIILSQIEEILDVEFAEYQKELNAQLDKMNDAIKRNQAKTLTDEESRELKKLYRRIVKSLHPDLHPDLGDEHLKMFENAVTAYKNGDLATLRIIEEMVYNPKLSDECENAMVQLVKEKERLTHMLHVVKECIADIKLSYPYAVKELILDQVKTDARKAELENVIIQYDEAIKFYSERIHNMLR